MIIYNYFIKCTFFIFFIVHLTHFSYSEKLSNTEDEVREISGLLMCPVCQGQAVSESNSQLAQDMRKSIRSQIEQGKTKEEILKYFTSRYGDSILASPPASGINWLIWLLPTAGLLIISLILGNFVYKSQINDKSHKKNEDRFQDKIIQKIEHELDDFKV